MPQIQKAPFLLCGYRNESLGIIGPDSAHASKKEDEPGKTCTNAKNQEFQARWKVQVVLSYGWLCGALSTTFMPASVRSAVL